MTTVPMGMNRIDKKSLTSLEYGFTLHPRRLIKIPKNCMWKRLTSYRWVIVRMVR